jgi:adenylate cyclase
LGGLAGTLLSLCVGLLLLYFKPAAFLTHLSYDLPFYLRPTADPLEAVIIYMDDESHDALGQPRNKPWDRRLHARLLERLTAEQARAIVFDIVFTDPANVCETNDPTDLIFAQAIKANGRVVLGADEVVTSYGSRAVTVREIKLPIDLLLENAATIASVETMPEVDLVIRRHLPRSKVDTLPGLAWAAAELAGAPLTKDPRQLYARRWLNYYGPPTTIRSVSYHRALSTNAVPLGAFHDKIVFIGARIFTKFAGERKDEYPHPWSVFSHSQLYRFMPGVEVQATQFLNLVRGDWLRRPPLRVEALCILAVAAGLGYGLVQLRPSRASAHALLAALIVALVAYGGFLLLRVWFAWLVIEVVIAMAWLWAVTFNSVREYLQRRLFEQSLSLYLSPKLVKKFATRPDLLKPGAEKQTLTILFSDIANFTTIAEGMDPDDLAALMNRYFENAIANCIHKTDGTVVKYIGDAIFAIWNAPEQQPDHAARACEAALAFSKQVVTFTKNETTWILRTRIGLHTGVANVGNFGSQQRFDYTALGENINLASRMEGLNKYLRTHVLLTEATQAPAGDRIVTRYLGEFQLKGFEKAVSVYELIGTPEESAASQPARDAFALALSLFQRRDFAKAAAAFQRVVELKNGDGPSEFYLAQIAELRDEALPEDWAGQIELKEK